MELQKKNNIFLFSFFCFFVLVFLSLSIFAKVEVAMSFGEPCNADHPCPDNQFCVDDGTGNALRQEMRCTRGGVPQDDRVGAHGGDVARRIQ